MFHKVHNQSGERKGHYQVIMIDIKVAALDFYAGKIYGKTGLCERLPFFQCARYR
jgi:hypothetical protein